MEISNPQVTLDTTLADHYAAEYHAGDPRTILVPCYWCSDVDYNEFIPRTAKYLYQGTPPPKTEKEKRELVIQCLSLECQRFGFSAGGMEIVLFDISGFTSRLDAIKTFGVFPVEQRSKVIFTSGLVDLMSKRPETQLAVVVPHEIFVATVGLGVSDFVLSYIRITRFSEIYSFCISYSIYLFYIIEL